jgi:hypothetical protein
VRRLGNTAGRPIARCRRASHPIFSMACRLALLAVMTLAAACSGRIPHPPYANHPPAALVEVDYPPPPARVEFVPKRPMDNAVWLNGEWSWSGRRWAWKEGGWVVVPQGARYAKLALVRRKDGKLFAAGGTWRNAQGGEIAAPEFVKAGGAPATSIVDPEGDPAPTAGDLRPDGGTGPGRASSPEDSAPDSGSSQPDGAPNENERQQDEVPKQQEERRKEESSP